MKIHKKDNYYKISTYDLHDGMNLDFEVFYEYNNEYVVALKNSTLTEELLNKLKKLEATYENLYVKKENYDNISSQISAYVQYQRFLEFNSDYSDLTARTSDIIQKSIETKSIDKKTTDTLAFNIKDQVIKFDANEILQVVNNVVRTDDQYLYTHSTNVAFLNGLIGKWLELPEKDIITLTKIGLLHDIGKTRVPDEILNKPSTLTNEEFEIIKKHPLHSFDMLVEAGETDVEVLLAVRGHHEKTNGTGYPDQLKYEKITLFARITTISDIYDAMVSKRCYKKLHSPFEVLEEFATGRFSNLDTHLINLFLTNMPKELIGKSVLMSDGNIGTVMYVNPRNYAFPVVKVADKIFNTTPELRCVSTIDFKQ